MAIRVSPEVDIDEPNSIRQSGDTEARPPEALSDPSTTDVHASLPAGLLISNCGNRNQRMSELILRTAAGICSALVLPKPRIKPGRCGFVR